MRMILGAVAAAVALCAPLCAAAQQPPAPSEPAWAVEEIVVRAAAPRLWKLVKGPSTVWILGAIEPVPRRLQWNSSQVARVIATSDKVLLPPSGTVGLFEAFGALMRSHLPRKETLDGTLPPDLAAAYRQTLVRLGRDPADHQHDKPGWAALMLRFDLARFGGLSGSEPVRTIRAIARDKNVTVSRIASYQAGTTLKQMIDLPDAQGETAVREAVRGVNFALDHAETAGQAWARGDLALVRTNVSPETSFTSLLRQTAAYKALELRAVDDTVAAVNEVLEKPGVTFVVLSLPTLVRQDGALARLRREGVIITEPSE